MHLFGRNCDHDYQFELLIRGAGCDGTDGQSPEAALIQFVTSIADAKAPRPM